MGRVIGVIVKDSDKQFVCAFCEKPIQTPEDILERINFLTTPDHQKMCEDCYYCDVTDEPWLGRVRGYELVDNPRRPIKLVC